MLRRLYLSLPIAALVIMAYMPALLAQEAADQAPVREQGWQMMMTLGIAVLFAYFILWRPERKRQKTLQQQRSSLKSGDRVVAMGIIGTVISVKEQSIILRMYDGAKIEVLTAAISDVQAPGVVEAEKV